MGWERGEVRGTVRWLAVILSCNKNTVMLGMVGTIIQPVIIAGWGDSARRGHSRVGSCKQRLSGKEGLKKNIYLQLAFGQT